MQSAVQRKIVCSFLHMEKTSGPKLIFWSFYSIFCWVLDLFRGSEWCKRSTTTGHPVQNKYVLVILRVCNRGVPGQWASCLFYKSFGVEFHSHCILSQRCGFFPHEKRVSALSSSHLWAWLKRLCRWFLRYRVSVRSGCKIKLSIGFKTVTKRMKVGTNTDVLWFATLSLVHGGWPIFL